MARIWPIEPAIPSPTVLDLERRVREEAGRLFAEGRSVEDHRLMALSEALNAWAVTLERLATTAPEHLHAVARSFDDHPQHDVAVDPRVAHRAVADFLAFIGVGDLVLNHLGRLHMRQRHGELPAEADGFAAALRDVDDQTVPSGIRTAFRRSQVTLRSARNRLLAHRRPDHAITSAWDRDDTPHVRLHPLAPESAITSAIETLNGELVSPFPPEMIGNARTYVEQLVNQAPLLNSDELFALDRAMRVAGFPGFSVRQAVDDVLAITSGVMPPTSPRL